MMILCRCACWLMMIFKRHLQDTMHSWEDLYQGNSSQVSPFNQLCLSRRTYILNKMQRQSHNLNSQNLKNIRKKYNHKFSKNLKPQNLQEISLTSQVVRVVSPQHLNNSHKCRHNQCRWRVWEHQCRCNNLRCNFNQCNNNQNHSHLHQRKMIRSLS